MSEPVFLTILIALWTFAYMWATWHYKDKFEEAEERIEELEKALYKADEWLMGVDAPKGSPVDKALEAIRAPLIKKEKPETAEARVKILEKAMRKIIQESKEDKIQEIAVAAFVFDEEKS